MISLKALCLSFRFLNFFIKLLCNYQLLFIFQGNELCLLPFVVGIDLLVLIASFLWIYLDCLVFLDFILLENCLQLLPLLCENSELVLFLAIFLLLCLRFIRSDLILLLPYQAISFVCLCSYLDFFACSLILNLRLCYHYWLQLHRLNLLFLEKMLSC